MIKLKLKSIREWVEVDPCEATIFTLEHSKKVNLLSVIKQAGYLLYA